MQKNEDRKQRGQARCRTLAAAFVEGLEARLFLSAAPTSHWRPHHLPQLPHQTFQKKKPANNTHHGVALPISVLRPEATVALTGASAPPSNATTPAMIRGAYGIGAYGNTNFTFNGAQADGTGQTIAIIDAYDDPNALSDLHAFDQTMGLPDPPSFIKVNENGNESSLPGTDPDGANYVYGTWEEEESLDIEYSHAMAPGAKIILVEASTDNLSDLATGVNWARNEPGVSAISMSWGEGETGNSADEETYDPIFSTPAGHQGVTFVASTGDSGAYDPGTNNLDVEYPAVSSTVLAVGGTQLSISGTSWSGETAWGSGSTSGTGGGGGGGISAYENQPAFQHGSFNTFSTTRRTIPDVSAIASPNSPGVALYDSWDFGASTPWLSGYEGGTSLAAPVWAGIVSVANQGRVSNGLPTLDGSKELLPILYSLRNTSGAFHDITSGSNGYSAAVGYDLATGIGSPGSSLIPDVVGYSAPAPVITAFTLTPSTITSASQSQTFSVTVTGTTTEVDYYLESNGLDGLQTGTGGDTLLKAVTNSAGGYAYTLPSYSGGNMGNYTIYAVAKNGSVSGSAVAANSNYTAGSGTTPTIGSFTAANTTVYVGGTISLTATNINDTGGIAQYVNFYQESNSTTGLQIGPTGDTLAGSQNTPSNTSSPNTSNWTINTIAPTTPGTYIYYAQTTDMNTTTNYVVSSPIGTSAPSVTITVLALAESSTVIGDGTAQRSAYNTVTIAFNTPVNIFAGGITIAQITTDSNGNVTSTTDMSSGITVTNPSNDGKTWIVKVVSGGVLDNGNGNFINGMFRITLHASLITTQQGDAPLSAGNTTLPTFWALFGDINGDGIVNGADFFAFRNAFGYSTGNGNYVAGFDYNCDGTINGADFFQFKADFGIQFNLPST